MGLDSASVNLVKAFLPFTLAGFTDRGDVGILSAVGPVQMGASEHAIKEEMAKTLRAYAYNDRRGLARAGRSPAGRAGKFRIDIFASMPQLQSLAKTAMLNGASRKDAFKLVDAAVRSTVGELYNDLLDALPDTVDGPFDAHRVGKIARALARLSRDHKKIVSSLEEKMAKRHRSDPRLLRLWSDLVRQGMMPTYEPPRRRYDY